MLDINELKSLLGIDTANTDYDSILNMIINSVISFTENYTNLKLGVETKDVRYIGNDRVSMYLDECPILQINSVLTYQYGSSEANAEDITSYVDVFDSINGLVFRTDYNKFFKNYFYVFNVTYGIEEIPSDLKYAMYMLAVSSYGMIDNVKQGVSRLATPDGTISYSFNLLPNSIREIFDIYKVKVL